MFNKLLKKRYPKHLNAIRFIESLLFLSMLPMHTDYPSRQHVMLATGVIKLDAIVNELGMK